VKPGPSEGAVGQLPLTRHTLSNSVAGYEAASRCPIGGRASLNGASNTYRVGCPGVRAADLCDTSGMSGVLEFLERPRVLMAVGVIMLLLAIVAFVNGGRGIFTGIVLIAAGGRSVWRGFTKWQAESGPR
jgi:hypothetical protein